MKDERAHHYLYLLSQLWSCEFKPEIGIVLAEVSIFIISSQTCLRIELQILRFGFQNSQMRIFCHHNDGFGTTLASVEYSLDPVNHLESVWEYPNAQLVKTRAWIPALSMLGRIVLGQIQTKFENCLGLGWVCYSCENPLAETQKLLLFSRQQWFIQISSGLEKKLNTCWVRIQLDYHPRRLGQIQTKKW